MEKRSKSGDSFRWIFLEGKLLIEEAFKAGALNGPIEINNLFHLNSVDVLNKEKSFLQGLKSGKARIEIGEGLMNKWSSVKTNQGIMGFFFCICFHRKSVSYLIIYLICKLSQNCTRKK